MEKIISLAIGLAFTLVGAGLLPHATKQLAIMAADAQKHQLSLSAFTRQLTGGPKGKKSEKRALNCRK